MKKMFWKKNASAQSQRDCITQPRVGATAPALGARHKSILNPNGVASFGSRAATLSGLMTSDRATQGSSRNPGLIAAIPLGCKAAARTMCERHAAGSFMRCVFFLIAFGLLATGRSVHAQN